MNEKYPRRQFIKTVPVAAWAMSRAVESLAADTKPNAPKLAIETFENDGVRLLPSRWQAQYQAARNFWLGLNEDDILHGFRADAGLPAPGKPLGGWASRTTGGIFGQWLSGMARMAKATGDTEIRDKAVRLFTEWAKTIGPDANPRMGHYSFEKLTCGLIDLQMYAGCQEAGDMLAKVIDYAAEHFDHQNIPATTQRGSYAGRPGEWYTLAENPYRAYFFTGDERYKKFGDMWLYHAYWDKLLNTSNPQGMSGVHAYSHVNTYSSAAMAYLATGDQQYLRIIKNAYDFLQNYQCYATGGYGPNEMIVASDGGIGRSLDTRSDSFETACGSWSVFKLGRYLMTFTGEARYGDWIERILYNGIGAALPVTPEGKNFYYSEYRTTGGMKVYNWEMWTCCSGSYIQAVADYPNLIYFKDANSLYVNLFVPSEVTWKRPDGDVKLSQDTKYPEAETTTLIVESAGSGKFALKFRVPAWATEMLVKVNGELTKLETKPGLWATLERTWQAGDKIEVRILLKARMLPVDKEHPDRVAVVRGPVVLALESNYQDPKLRLPDTDEALNKWLVPDRPSPLFGTPSKPEETSWPTTSFGPDADKPIHAFSIKPPDGSVIRCRFQPFYAMIEAYPYRMYFDKKTLPNGFW